MPPKRKDNTSISTTSSSLKRSKPAFRTPTTTGSNISTLSQPSSSKNRVVTLRTSATGRRGYRSQDFLSNPESNPNFSAIEDLTLPATSPTSESTLDTFESDSHIPCVLHKESGNAGTDISSGKVKPRTKQKNTTTVRL